MTLLDEFGKRLIAQVRDEVISDWEMIADGKMKGERADRIRAKITANSEVVRLIVPDIVDSVLHRLLDWAENDPMFSLCYKEGDVFKPIENESDGLAGELYGNRGWISRFSQREM